MRKYFNVCVMFFPLLFCQATEKKTVESAFLHAEKQTKYMLEEIDELEKQNGKELVSPRSIAEDGNLKMVVSRDWTSGFYPGVLWYLYEYTQNDFWKQKAVEFTSNIEREKWNATTHDMGFKIYCSFGNGLRLTKNAHYKDVIIESAATLVKRFNPNVGAIRSWDHNKDKWDFPVIIDNMMNLELLFEATKMTGDSTYYDVAVAHANTTLKNHFRKDNSSFHVISYDPETGEVEKRNTHQGYGHQSSWSRGQAWGLYGFTMCYRYTGNEAYLKQAEKIARFMLDHRNMPADLVPYWDYDAPGIPNEERDASAAAVMASALYEMGTYLGKRGELYAKSADKIISSLSTDYVSPIGENKGFILIHSTGAKPSNNEVDVPLIYADYYYLEALIRKDRLENQRPLTE